MVPPSRDILSYENVDVHATSDTSALTIPDPLTCTGVLARRLKAGPLSGGVAAATSSELFKSKVFFQTLLERFNCLARF